MDQDRVNRTEKPALRVGDAERQQTADHLISAHGLGQLDTDEMAERLEAVHAAKFRSDLDPLTADLPAPPASSVELSGLPRFRSAVSSLSAISNARNSVLILLAALSGATFALMYAGGHPEYDGYQHDRFHGPGHEFEGGPSAWLLLIPILVAILTTAAWFVHRRRQQRR